MTRIVAGKAGGVRLKTPPAVITRPTSERVREAIFSALAAWNGSVAEPVDRQMAGIRFLDLFAGSGAIGLEAASRGANSVLVEKDRNAGRVIKENEKTTKLAVDLKLMPVAKYLDNASGDFDVIFFDPPYADEVDELIELALPLLKADGLLVVERDRRSAAPKFPSELGDSWKLAYGETVIYYAQRSSEES